MTYLNLLPWRELRRKELDNQIRNIAVGVAIIMAGLVYWAYLFMGGLIDEQQQRNSFLQNEIKKVEQELKEVNKVKKKKAQLIARMEVIQKLQSDRTRMVRLFDGLARNLPKGMYLNLFEIKGNKITIKGAADSNGTISKFMHLVEAAENFSTPNLNVINIKNSEGLRVSNFTIKFNFIKSKKKTDKEDASEPAASSAKKKGARK